MDTWIVVDGWIGSRNHPFPHPLKTTVGEMCLAFSV
jgi:hypothetical protein